MEANQQMLDARKVVKALCPNCSNRHILDNGRVWGFCQTQRLIQGELNPEGYSEKEVYKLLEKLFGPPVD